MRCFGVRDEWGSLCAELLMLQSSENGAWSIKTEFITFITIEYYRCMTIPYSNSPGLSSHLAIKNQIHLPTEMSSIILGIMGYPAFSTCFSRKSISYK